MKEIFKSTTAQLGTIPSLKWIDEEKGQLNFERPPVLFPCALVDITLPKTKDMNRKLQECDVIITVRLAFDFAGNTSNETPDEARDKSLEYYDIVEEVYQLLHGWTDGRFNPLSRAGFYPEKRPDGYKVVAMPFVTQFLDDSGGI